MTISDKINIIVRDYGLEKLSASEAHDVIFSLIEEALNEKQLEIDRLRPYVDAFRREEARADKLGKEIDDLRSRNFLR